MAEKHGIIGLIVKKLMIIIFSIIGLTAVIINAIYVGKHTEPKWYYITNLVFGCCLFTSPFFLKKEDRGILVKVIKILMIIVFVLIGIAYISAGTYGLVKKYEPNWIYIVHISFGALLLTSPYFLKKD